MTMLSFRVEADEASDLAAAADELGVSQSEVLRDALHRRLIQLKAERDTAHWNERPMTTGERELMGIEHWEPAEDWSDWDDATR